MGNCQLLIMHGLLAGTARTAADSKGAPAPLARSGRWYSPMGSYHTCLSQTTFGANVLLFSAIYGAWTCCRQPGSRRHNGCKSSELLYRQTADVEKAELCRADWCRGIAALTGTQPYSVCNAIYGAIIADP